MADLSQFMDFMEDEGGVGGFDSPLMPSRSHPNGKSYHVPSPDAATGMWLSTLAELSMKAKQGGKLHEGDAERLKLDDEQEREFIPRVLSRPVFDEMVADGVRWEHMKRLSSFAFTYFAIGKDVATSAAEAGAFSGKVLAPANREQRRAATKKTTPTSGTRATTSGSGASRTRKTTPS